MCAFLDIPADMFGARWASYSAGWNPATLLPVIPDRLA